MRAKRSRDGTRGSNRRRALPSKCSSRSSGGGGWDRVVGSYAGCCTTSPSGSPMKAQRCDSTTPDPTTEVQADFDDSAIGVDPTGRYSNELSAFLHEMVP